MRNCLGRLIIMPPSSPGIHQFRLTRRAFRLAVLSSVICLCAAAILGYMRPQPVPDAERARLEQENRTLKTQNKDLGFQSQKLQDRVSHLEEVSKHITDLMATGQGRGN